MMERRFEYPFRSHYATVDGIRLHCLDEGQGPVIWLMHGNTSWSYLYRKMIPILVKAGYRCFVPDLMGFGLSDNPEDESAYSLRTHVELMTDLVRQLDLRDIVTVGQDWGGPIALRYALFRCRAIPAHRGGEQCGGHAGKTTAPVAAAAPAIRMIIPR
jgi:haloalkane dehalogenase